MNTCRRMPRVAVAVLAVALASVAWAQETARPPEITIDRERLCPLVDGEPFFAIGACGIPADQMPVAAEAGFNLTIRWGGSGGNAKLKRLAAEGEDTTRSFLRQYFDAAEQAGLLLIEMPTMWNYDGLYGGDPHFDDHMANFIEAPLPTIVRAVRDHPALFGYYGPDEPPPSRRDACAAYATAIRELDPDHPLFFLYCQDVPDWPEVFDIAGRDYYPAEGRTTVISVLRAAQRSAESAHSQRLPFWHMPLMHIYSGSRMRPISPSRQRAQVYLALVGGANGIVWWVWPPGHADNWATIKEVISELRKLSPVLTEPPAPTTVRWEPERLRDTVQVRAIQRKDITFLLAVNAAERPATARITLPADVKPRAPVWFEDRVVDIGGRSFTDSFEALGTHVYEIHGQWPASEEIRIEVTLAEPGREPAMREIGALEQNLLLDPGFENDPYWTFDARDDTGKTAIGTFDTGTKTGGRRSALIERTGPARVGVWSGRWGDLKAGGRHTFGGWTRAEMVDGRASLYLTGTDRDIRYSTETAISDYTPWRQFSLVFATDESVRVRPEIRFQAGTGKVWVDDLFLIEAPEHCPNLVVNGGFEGGTYAADYPRWWMSGLYEPGHIGGPDQLWGLMPDDVFEGERCLRLTDLHPADYPEHAHAEQMLAPGTVLHPGQSYVLSAYLKGSRPDLPAIAFAGGWHSYHQFTVTDTWQRYSFVYEPEAEVTQPFVHFGLREQGTLLVDAVQFERGAEPTEYQEWSE